MKQFVNDTEYEIIWLKRSSTEIETIYSFYKHFASEVVAKRRIGIIIHSVDILKKMKTSPISENTDFWSY